MRYSNYFIPTLREVPSDAEVISHQLMLRAGMIRKLTSGIYTYLPLGLRSIRKIETIIREEMNRAGALELLMPAVQPGELWQESGRWDHYGRELLRFKDRHDRDACLGPTHEEVITDLVRREIRSHRQMPVNFYQIQTKFRDEIRPRFGLMRCREFIMKDAYSFDADEAGANRSYEAMYEAYSRIFTRCGLAFRVVEADTGTIGGSYSHEFMVLAETGEDQIVGCQSCQYAANLERAEVRASESQPPGEEAEDPLESVHTPGQRSVEEVTRYLSVSPAKLLKTLILLVDGEPVAAVLRGDHELNPAKVRNLLGAETVELADPARVHEITGAPLGFAGPLGLSIPVLADHAVRGVQNAVTGANREDYHFKGVNLGRDFQVERFGDLRLITPSDPCPRCGAPLLFRRGIEVGHIFKLGTKYSKALKAMFLDPEGKERPIVMGCYGIGVGRTLAAAIEQNHDRDGIVFPVPLAPFEVMVLPLQMHDPEVSRTAQKIYHDLLETGTDVLLDDRDERAGVKFKDADLLGMPLAVVIGSRGLEKGEVVIKIRRNSERLSVPVSEAPERVPETLAQLS